MRNTNLEGMDFAVTETATFQIPAMQEENVLVNPILHQLMATLFFVFSVYFILTLAFFTWWVWFHYLKWLKIYCHT